MRGEGRGGPAGGRAGAQAAPHQARARAPGSPGNPVSFPPSVLFPCNFIHGHQRSTPHGGLPRGYLSVVVGFWTLGELERRRRWLSCPSPGAVQRWRTIAPCGTGSELQRACLRGGQTGPETRPGPGGRGAARSPRGAGPGGGRALGLALTFCSKAPKNPGFTAYLSPGTFPLQVTFEIVTVGHIDVGKGENDCYALEVRAGPGMTSDRA